MQLLQLSSQHFVLWTQWPVKHSALLQQRTSYFVLRCSSVNRLASALQFVVETEQCLLFADVSGL